MRRTLKGLTYLLKATSFLVVAAAVASCGSGNGEPTVVLPTPTPPGVQIRTASTDITVGPSRLLFGIFDEAGAPLGPAEVTVRVRRTEEEGGATVTETAALHLGAETPAAAALYSVRLELTDTGGYLVEAEIKREGRASATAVTGFRAKTRYDTPGFGQPAPASVHPTLADAPIEQLTSARPPGDPALYRLTIADALAEGKPLMVVFSTPAFCGTQTCGPQLEVAEALADAYGERMNFVHVEVMERPDLVLAGEAEPVVRAVVREWRLPTEPWVFLIDADGLVFDRFEGFSPRFELEASVRQLLGEPPA